MSSTKENGIFLEDSESGSSSSEEASHCSDFSICRDSSSLTFSSIEDAFFPSEFPNTVDRILEARAASEMKDYMSYPRIEDYSRIIAIPDRFLPSLVHRLNRMSDSDMKNLSDRTVEAAMYFMCRERLRRRFMDIGYGKDIVPVLRLNYEQLPDHLSGTVKEHFRTDRSTASSRSSLESNTFHSFDSNTVLQPGRSGLDNSLLPYSSIQPSSSESDSFNSNKAQQTSLGSGTNFSESNGSSQLDNSKCSKSNIAPKLKSVRSRSNNADQEERRSLQELPPSKEEKYLTNIEHRFDRLSSWVRKSTERPYFKFRTRNRFGYGIDLF